MLEQDPWKNDCPQNGVRNSTQDSRQTSRTQVLQFDDTARAYVHAFAQIVADSRPQPLREFDQIPMRTKDLAIQAIAMAPLLAGRRVAFVGDMDGAASLFGIMAAIGEPAPAKIMLYDFDSRVLAAAEELSKRFGFGDILTVHLYNCFERLPLNHHGTADWFYTNPPYGSQNAGESTRLFITRGIELVDPEFGSGCLIAPDDESRPWTRQAMEANESFFQRHGWRIRTKVDDFHRYHLDDDPTLSSALVIIDRLPQSYAEPMLFAGRTVGTDEIPDFYGRSTRAPYPRTISLNGDLVGTLAA